MMERSTQSLSIVLYADHTCSKWRLNDGEIYTITEHCAECRPYMFKVEAQ